MIPAAQRLSSDPDRADFYPSDYSCPGGTKPFSMGTYNQDYRFVTCHCEDHCSWYKCRLEQPPMDCLDVENSSWKWNAKRKYWVAQIKPGRTRTSKRCLFKKV